MLELQLQTIFFYPYKFLLTALQVFCKIFIYYYQIEVVLHLHAMTTASMNFNENTT